jgi:hypothetical protein
MNKKFLILALATLFIVAFALDVEVYASQLNVTYNGRPVAFPDQGPVIVDGRTLVPIAPVINAINPNNNPSGLLSEWRGSTRQVHIRRGEENITLSIDSRTIATEVPGINNGAPGTRQIDVPPQIIGDRTMVPLAAVLELFGFSVTWNGATSTVVVSDSGQVAVAPAASPSPRQIAEAIIASQGGIAGMVPLLHNDEFFDAYLSENYQISPNMVSNGVVFYVDFTLVDDMPADEIAVFELAPGANSAEIAAALRSYIQRRASQFEGYAPDSAAVASRGIVVSGGNFIAMIICHDPQAAEAAFLTFFQ